MMTAGLVAWRHVCPTPTIRARFRGPGLVVILLALFGFSVAAEAQENTGLELWDMAGCFACHGDLAAGDGDAANVVGPSLRRRLKTEVVLKAISCGRPGADMPSFLIDAYKSPLCSPTPLESPPDNVSVYDMYSEEQVQVLVAWLEANVIGKKKITLESCAVFFDGDVKADQCRQY
jgi:hypothetical protein